jgi:hypothetical protein
VQRSKEKERPGSDARPFCIFLRLIAVALLNLPQAVLLLRQYMVGSAFSAHSYKTCENL